MKIQKVNNILTDNIIDNIKKELRSLEFEIGRTTEENENKLFTNNMQFEGMSKLTIPPKNDNENKLNMYAFIITELVCKKINLQYKHIKRFMWNYYTKGQKCNFHVDHKDENFMTIVYSFNTCNGYLRVEDDIIEDMKDEAKIFKSNLPHAGYGPSTDTYRINLNVIVEI
jgi:hypothetical protein